MPKHAGIGRTASAAARGAKRVIQLPATLIERLANELRSAEVAPESIGALKLSMLHFLTCAFEARDLPWSRQAQALAMRTSGEASIVGRSYRAAVPDAAFANAVAGHGLVREDMHAGAVSHLGVVVLPAMLALAQRHRTSGRAFATACIIGYEVGARIGRALVTPTFVGLWRPTGFTGPLAAAAAGARLLDLSAAATGSALALAANTACGLNQWPHEGGEEMFFHPGIAARSGLLALDLAALGTYGSSGALDGPAGLLNAVGAGEAAGKDVTLFPRGSAEILAVFRKALPVCNFAQTPCQAALDLVKKNHFGAASIASVRIRASAAAIHYPGCASRGPYERVLQAKMSIPYCVAMALVDGAVHERSFAMLDRAEILRVVAVTTMEADANFTSAFPAQQGSEVAVELTNGTRISERMTDLQPADPEAVVARFTQAAGEVLGAAPAAELADCVGNLEKLEDVSRLARLTEVTHPIDTAR